MEASLFVREGMSGLAVVLGCDRTLHEVVVQMAGHGHRIEADALRDAAEAEPGLRELLLRFVLAVLGQGAIATFANARLSPAPRSWAPLGHADAARC